MSVECEANTPPPSTLALPALTWLAFTAKTDAVTWIEAPYAARLRVRFELTIVSEPEATATPPPVPSAQELPSNVERSIDTTMGRSGVPTASIPPPETLAGLKAQGDGFWPLALARELDDALLHLRANEPELGLLVITTSGELERVCGHDALLTRYAEDWLVREILLFWKRTLKRLDLTSRSMIGLVEPGSCFAGILAELLFSVDRSYMLEGEFEEDNRPEAVIRLNQFNFGALPMSNGLSRLATRFLGEPETLEAAQSLAGEDLNASAALEAGLVTFTPDDIDWEDEIRIILEERASFSPDAMVGMEANLRFAGPETMETKIFGRLSAWQNWIFQRPNAVGEQGALKRYGSGTRPEYDPERV